MTSTASRMLGIVIITRNEAGHIAKCIESVLAAITESFADADIVVIDSDSEDDTTAIAARYPVRVFRYRGPHRSAAAGRWIGLKQVEARYVLFLDGDCQLVPGWLEVAVEGLETTPTAAVICGARQNAYEQPGAAELANVGTDLGGTALYRHEALDRCGGFNPFIIGSEEQELSVRLQACGYQSLRTPHKMSIHNTAKKESFAGMWRRYRSGMQSGPGQVLRVAMRDGLFLTHARRFDRYILTFVYLLLGALAMAFAAIGYPRPAKEWILIGAIGFLLLGWRRRSLLEATFIVTDWISVAIGSFLTFVRKPIPAEQFVYTLEPVRHSGCANLDSDREHALGPSSLPSRATS